MMGIYTEPGLLTVLELVLLSYDERNHFASPAGLFEYCAVAWMPLTCPAGELPVQPRPRCIATASVAQMLKLKP